MNLGFARVWLQIKNNYSALVERDREIVSSYVRVIISTTIFIILILIISRMFIENEIFNYIINVIAAAFSSMVVGFAFSTLDRIGILIPIERDFKTLIGLSDEQGRAIRASTEEIRNYSKYKIARDSIGFNSVIAPFNDKDGIQSEIDERKMDDKILEIFDNRGVGSNIYFMNSYITAHESYYKSIKAAVFRGANVKILLMYPDSKKPAVNARFIDYNRGVSGQAYDNVDDFVQDIIPTFRKFDRLRWEIEKEREKSDGVGNFDIRYYSVSLNFPMILVKDPNSTSDSMDVVYTGFYAGISSEKMPYIEWRGGSFRINSYFKSLFDEKWEECKGQTYIFPKNAPQEHHGDSI